MTTILARAWRRIRHLISGPKPVNDAGTYVQLQNIGHAGVELLRTTLLSNSRYADSKCLTRHGFKAYSQYDEDGILDEIFRRIGVCDRIFVEFGVGDGFENNTAYRLAAGWKGLWIEGSTTQVQYIKQAYLDTLAEGRLTVLESFITAETIEGLFSEGNVPVEFDLLSIDIDGNDYWVWSAIRHYRPRVVVVEYNSGIGPSIAWAMPYRADHVTDGSRAFGASLKAFERLGREKGYVLVGCGLSGVNAFFVRADLVGEHFLTPATSETHFEPPRYFLVPFPGHTPSRLEALAIAAGPPTTASPGVPV
jgi:hypothetical protein